MTGYYEEPSHILQLSSWNPQNVPPHLTHAKGILSISPPTATQQQQTPSSVFFFSPRYHASTDGAALLLLYFYSKRKKAIWYVTQVKHSEDLRDIVSRSLGLSAVQRGRKVKAHISVWLECHESDLKDTALIDGEPALVILHSGTITQTKLTPFSQITFGFNGRWSSCHVTRTKLQLAGKRNLQGTETILRVI